MRVDHNPAKVADAAVHALLATTICFSEALAGLSDGRRRDGAPGGDPRRRPPHRSALPGRRRSIESRGELLATPDGKWEGLLEWN